MTQHSHEEIDSDLHKGAVELLIAQGKYLDRLNESEARGMGGQQLLVLLGSARHHHTNLAR